MQQVGRDRELASGDLVNHRYEVLRKLGEGGMGRVYLVADRLEEGRELALKTLKADVGEPAYYEFFAHEFEALTKLKHPNLAEVYDFGRIEATGELFFTLEYIVGRNLYVATAHASVEVILDFMVQTCRALEYIHNRGLIHHDVKPENILVVENTSQAGSRPGQIKLMDFGLALEEELAQHAGEIRGTLSYLAPEVAAGYSYDRRADFYSLGIVLYRVLRRRLPFEESDQAETPFFSIVPRPPDPAKIDVDERFRPLVARLADPDPAERFADASQVVAEINRLFGTEYAVETRETTAGYVLSGQLVGRDRERARMEELLDELRRTALSVPLLLIGGQVGMGKSRLVREWKVKCQLAGVQFVSARCYENLRAPYGPAAELLRGLVSLAGPSSALVRRHREALARLVPEVRGDEEPPPVPSGPRERIRLIHALARFALEFAQERPLVLAIADMQWCDSETIELVKHLTRTLAVGAHGEGSALLICGAYREEELADTPLAALASDLGGEPLVERWILDRLGADEVGAFLRSMLGRDELPDALVSRIAVETDGNPYFIEEVMKALVEEGELRKTLEGWDVAVDPAQLKIPSSCEAVIQRRLDHLDDAAAEAIRLLAVLEEPAPLALLRAMHVGGVDAAFTKRGLRELTRLQLLRRQLGDDGYRYFLNHTATRRVVYDGLAPEQRAELHRLAAASIESLHAGGTGVVVRQLAHHHRRGGNRREAIRYGLAAAAESAALHAHQQAIDAFGEVLEALDAEPELVSDPRGTRLEVIGQLADLHKNLGQYATARDYYVEAEALAPDVLRRADLRRRLAEMSARRGQYPEALEIYGEVEAMLIDGADEAEEAGDDGASADANASAIFSPTLTVHELRAQLLVGVGRVHELLGHYDWGITQAEQALALEPPEAIRVTAYQLLGNLSWCLGRYHEAIQHHRRGLEIEEGRGNVFGLAACYNNLALVYQDLGELDQALALYEKSLHNWQRYGDPSGIALCLSNLGVLHKDRGAYERSVECHQRALTEYERLGDRIGVARINECLGEVHADLGQWAESERCHRRCLDICEQTGNVPLSIYAYINLGENFATFGALDQALENADVALERATQINARMLVGAAELLKGDILRRRRDWDAAMQYLERALELFEELGNRQEALKAATQLASLFHELGEQRTALERAQAALEDARELGNREQVAGLLHLSGVVRHAEGDLLAARRDLEDALTLAREIGRRELLWRLHHDLGRMLLDCGELETARRELMRAVAIGRRIWESLPQDLKGLFLEDPRHARLSDDVGRLRERVREADPR